jgi:hypothetical protein
LIAEYKNLSAAGQDLSEVQDQLKASADDLVASYTKMLEIFP